MPRSRKVEDICRSEAKTKITSEVRIKSLAITEMNMQNIPAKGEAKEIRKMFVSSPGYIFVGGDFSLGQVG